MDWRELYYSVPIATRSILITSTTAFVFSPFFPRLTAAFANVPYYVLFHFQVWRLLLAGMCADSVLSLVFGVLLFYKYGLMLEQERGSLLFLHSCITKTVLINGLICAASLGLGLFHHQLLSSHYYTRGGLFPLLLALMTTQTQRSSQPHLSFLGLVTVSTLYFPILLLFVFVLLGGNLIETSAAVGVGYLKHFGYLSRLEPSLSSLTALEASPWLRSFTSARTFVPTSQAGAVLPQTQPGAQPSTQPGTQPQGGVGAGFAALQSLWTRGTRGDPTFPGRGMRTGDGSGRRARGGGLQDLIGYGGFSGPAPPARASPQGGNVRRPPTRGSHNALFSSTRVQPTIGPGRPPAVDAEHPLPPLSPPSRNSRAAETPNREARAAAFLRAHENRVHQQQVSAEPVFAESNARISQYQLQPSLGSESEQQPLRQDRDSGTPRDFSRERELVEFMRSNEYQSNNENIPVGGGLSVLGAYQDQLNMLGEMGFSSEQSVRALRLSQGDIQLAAELLFNGSID